VSHPAFGKSGWVVRVRGLPVATLLVLCGFLLAAVQAVLGIVGAPVWARILGAVLVALVPVVSELDRLHGSRLEQEASKRREFRELLEPSSLGPDGFPIVVGEASWAAFGVKEARLIDEPPFLDYIDRDDDPQLLSVLDQAVATRRMLLVVGGSATGKSRSTAQAVKTRLPNHRLICPLPSMLASLRGLHLEKIEPTVVFLDDLDRQDHPNVRQALTAMLDVGATVVGTIRRSELQRRRPRENLRDPFAEALDDDTLVVRQDWKRDWSAKERSQADAKLHNAGLLKWIESGKPPGVWIVAGTDLTTKLDDAKADDDHPARYALVHTVLDWYRTGVRLPIPIDTARSLVIARTGDVVAQSDIDEALRWAEKPVLGEGRIASQALLTAIGGRLRIHEYVQDADRQTSGEPIVQAIWSAAVTLATPSDSFLLALSADHAGQRAVAEVALQNALESDDSDTTEWARLLLGDIEVRNGHIEVARELLTRAAGSNNDMVAGLAKVDLGALLLSSGAVEPARELLEAAMDSLNPLVVALAQTGLGPLLALGGDVEGAQVLLEAAIRSGNPLAVALARTSLGPLLAMRGDVEGAEELLDAAIRSGYPEVVAVARAHLGGLLANMGDVEGARELLEAAIGSTNPHVVLLAKANLGRLLGVSGDVEGARELLEAAIRSGSPLVVPLAKAHLGGLLATKGDLKQAQILLEEALGSTNPHVVALAKAHLGGLFATKGDVGQAQVLLEESIGSGNPLVVPLAKAHLGGLLAARGEVEPAKSLLEEAIGSAHPLAVPPATAHLGRLLAAGGEEKGSPGARGGAQGLTEPGRDG
jgi:tetratricopeptide (TPR) repeat protein